MRKIKALLILALILVALYKFTPFGHYAAICDSMTYDRWFYIPPETCIYQVPGGWEVMTWLHSIP